ncbi:MAG: hypothetical protein JWO79_1220 [Actinomycetia bacterium]|nr:hypothetical protein [Actinomycetes bacterium]
MNDTTMPVTVGGRPLAARGADVTGSLVDLGGRTFYRVTDCDAIPPFLMSLLSDSDHWFFVASTGAVSCGRVDPHHALLPYYTDDRVYDGVGDTGSVTSIRVHTGGSRQLWEPFSDRFAGAYRVSRNLYKSTLGDEIRFEEVNRDLGLTFACSWTLSERFGFVRTCSLTSENGATADVLDGLQNLLPAGADRFLQEHFSTLVDGHKDSEADQDTGLALYRLTSIPSDSAKPNEALRTAVAWSRGLDPAVRLVSALQLPAFRSGLDPRPETTLRGRRGAYLTSATITLVPGETREWITVADTALDAAAVVRLRRFLTSGTLSDGADAIAEVRADAERGSDALARIAASSDALQVTGDQLTASRHYSNVLFNVMRGGVPDNGYTVARADFAQYLRKASPRVARQHQQFLAALPETLSHADLAAAAAFDPELHRLTREFLPLTFSRRHGDPSRPWNNFAIALKDEHGKKILNYQGNWRDIFQNWEALAYSFPEYAESMIFKFVNASTADGHNPYRITQHGFTWEKLVAGDPHSHIGYWGDHQVVYLLKLLETSAAFHPGRIPALLGERLFTYAHIPYRIRPYADQLADPRDTIEFDPALDAELDRRAADQGAYQLGPDGEPLRVNLAEKLLVVALTKLASFVPEAGIWMNTQRPEWNDANNALVGYGVSMVTLYQLRRYLAFLRPLLTTDVSLSIEVAALFRSIDSALADHEHLLGGPIGDADRRSVLDALGSASTAYRARLYSAGLSGSVVDLPAADLDGFCALAIRHIDHTIRANRRDDGLYHSYNLLRIEGSGSDGGAIGVRRLYEMLEGQVAVLGSGALTAAEAADLLDALRASAMYRPDQNSYLLYPDRQLPRFAEKNSVPPSALDRSKLLTELAARGDERILIRDDDGGLHFHADFANASVLAGALAALAADPVYADLVEADRAAVLDVYEEVFDHQSFTGRSGTLYKYEGLGCIYWHMVSKLLLGISSVLAAGGPPEVTERLRAHYDQVRDGLGVHKSPAEHGAIPIDPYSHTPGFAGAQQPGMTGQVKEDIIGRIAELGLTVSGGRLVFRPDLVRSAEFLTSPGVLRYADVTGSWQSIDVPAGAFAFTFAQVPVVVHASGPVGVSVSGASSAQGSLELDAETSAAIFARTGTITRIDAHLAVR